MQVIRDARVLPSAQVRFKRTYTGLMGDVAASIAGLLVRARDAEGKIPPGRADDVVRQAGELVQAVFVVDGRRSVTAEGVPLSPYARALMTEIYMVTVGIVGRHTDWMDARLVDAPDVRAALLGRARLIGEQAGDRLFEPNPLAEYEFAHTWVDPNGYVLSQRIWRNGFETRRKLDDLMYDLIRQGVGAEEIARRVEQFLLPGRAKIRTDKPYGSDASYDAMRLARTEIARAHNQASWVSAYLNPYVDQVRARRSPNGSLTCRVCLGHAGPVGGEGIVYPVTSANIPPWHPHCMCRIDAEVTRSPQSVTNELRDFLLRGEAERLPMLTPLQRDTFVQMILGDALTGFVRQLVLGQLRLF